MEAYLKIKESFPVSQRVFIKSGQNYGHYGKILNVFDNHSNPIEKLAVNGYVITVLLNDFRVIKIYDVSEITKV